MRGIIEKESKTEVKRQKNETSRERRRKISKEQFCISFIDIAAEENEKERKKIRRMQD